MIIYFIKSYWFTDRIQFRVAVSVSNVSVSRRSRCVFWTSRSHLDTVTPTSRYLHHTSHLHRTSKFKLITKLVLCWDQHIVWQFVFRNQNSVPSWKQLTSSYRR